MGGVSVYLGAGHDQSQMAGSAAIVVCFWAEFEVDENLQLSHGIRSPFGIEGIRYESNEHWSAVDVTSSPDLTGYRQSRRSRCAVVAVARSLEPARKWNRAARKPRLTI